MNLEKNKENSGIWADCLDYATCTDVGLRRTNNQDSHAVVLASNQEIWNTRGHLFLVADGMGAHAAGELASKIAADSVPLAYNKQLDKIPPVALKNAIIEANDVIHRRGNSSDDFRGMGTTCCCVLFLPEGALIGHVGDSRIYRQRGDAIQQMTFDHSLVWEMRLLSKQQGKEYTGELPKNVITRCLGVHPEVVPDIEGPFPLQPGDTYLLCSDGLSGQVTDEEIGMALRTLPPSEAVLLLRDLAILRGGPDNITVVVARYLGPQQAKGAALSSVAQATPAIRKPFSPVLLSLAAFSLLLAVCLIKISLVAAAVGLLITIAIAGFALAQHGNGISMDRRPYGHGPYVQASAAPDDNYMTMLQSMIDETRETAQSALSKRGDEGAKIWKQFLTLENQAKAAKQDKKNDAASADLGRALHLLIDNLA